MHLVQLLLPLYDNEGSVFPRGVFDRVRQELTESHGGATAFLRSPAEGLWKDEGQVSRDEVVLIEVMAKRLDRQWWAEYSSELKRRFRQDELVIRALVVDLL